LKPDKLPFLDPNVRGIFDRIIVTVAEIRKHRRSEEYRREQERFAISEKTRHDARELERKRQLAEAQNAQRYAAAMQAGFIPVERIPMRESETPKFVR
jgi:uncharacterized protein YaiL (DUF2058 family)